MNRTLFIQDYFLSKKHSLSIIEGDMTTNDFEVFVDKLIKVSANIKIKTNNEEREILNDMDDPIGLGFARRCLVRRFPS